MYDCTREKISFANGTNNNGPKYPINNIRNFVRNTIINIEKNCSMTINANSQMQIVSYIRKCIVQGKKLYTQNFFFAIHILHKRYEINAP